MANEGQILATSTMGGYMTTPRLSRKLRFVAQPAQKFRQFCNVKEAWGKHQGEVVLFDKCGNISSAGGTLVETATIAYNHFGITQGTATITEMGNGIMYSGKLEVLAEYNVESAVQKTLRHDWSKVIDGLVATEFRSSDWKYVCTGTGGGDFTSNSACTGTAASNLTAAHIREIVKMMKKLNIPPYDSDGNYICIGSVDMIENLFSDVATAGWVEAHKYSQPENIFNGEVGKMYGVRFVEENNSLVNTISTSYGEAVFFGADAVFEAIAVPEEIRIDYAKDFGRKHPVGWYGLAGWKKIWDYSVDGEGHIIHCTGLNT